MPVKLDDHLSRSANSPMSNASPSPRNAPETTATAETVAFEGDADLLRHEKDLLRYAHYLLGHPGGAGASASHSGGGGAADVVQDTFARFWAQPAETRDRLCDPEPSGTNGHASDNGSSTPRPPHDRLRAWLFTVCRNRAFDVRRKERRMTPLAAPVAEAQTHPSPGPAHLAEQRDANAAVLRRLADLPDQQQEVVRLKFQADLSYKQIAAVTGLTVSHVGVLLHQALKTLRQDLLNPD